MILFKNIVSNTKPTTAKEVISYFRGDERIKGKRLKFFNVKYDELGTQMDDYTSYYNIDANHYDIIAVFE